MFVRFDTLQSLGYWNCPISLAHVLPCTKNTLVMCLLTSQLTKSLYIGSFEVNGASKLIRSLLNFLLSSSSYVKNSTLIRGIAKLPIFPVLELYFFEFEYLLIDTFTKKMLNLEKSFRKRVKIIGHLSWYLTSLLWLVLWEILAAILWKLSNINIR